MLLKYPYSYYLSYEQAEPFYLQAGQKNPLFSLLFALPTESKMPYHSNYCKAPALPEIHDLYSGLSTSL